MSGINTNLLNSLMWNLREMTNLIKQMRNRIGDLKCTSWRHPLVSCMELDVLQLLENSKDCDRYTYLLELTFDRLIYILNLLIKYMESSEALSRFRPGKNVERPKNLSMASILYMIWERIQHQTENNELRHGEQQYESNKTFKLKGTVSSSTQSDITVISTCMSCELAQNLVTQIVLKMENLFGEDASTSALFKERKLMKEKLIDTSNWSAMMAWVNAVLKDLSTICDETERFKADNRKLKSRIDSSETNLMAKVNKHEEDVKNMQKLCKENEEKSKFLEREIKSLREERQKLYAEFSHQNAELKSRNAELEKLCAESRSRNKTLEERLARKEKIEQERNEEFKLKIDAEIKKRESAHKDVEHLKNSLARMKAEKEFQQEEANSHCSSLQAIIEELQETVATQREENARLLRSLTEKQEEIHSSSQKLLEAFPDISEEKSTKYKGTGDPVTDMRHQIEANKLRISQLILHNENLTQTIDRIEDLKK